MMCYASRSNNILEFNNIWELLTIRKMSEVGYVHPFSGSVAYEAIRAIGSLSTVAASILT